MTGSIELAFLFGVGKIGLIVFLVLHLLVVLVRTRQDMLAGRLVKTKLRGVLVSLGFLHAIILFLILILTVLTNPF